MEIFETDDNTTGVLRIVGHINSANAPQLNDRIGAMLGRGCRAIVIDMTWLEHMTSAGFRSLLLAERRVETDGAAMVICGLQGLALDLFRIGGFLEMFAIAESRTDALRLVALPAERSTF